MLPEYFANVMIEKFSAKSNLFKAENRSIQIFGKLGVPEDGSWTPKYKSSLNIYCENHPEGKDNKIYKSLSEDTVSYRAYILVSQEILCEILNILNSCGEYNTHVIRLYTSENLTEKLCNDEYLEIHDVDYSLSGPVYP